MSGAPLPSRLEAVVRGFSPAAQQVAREVIERYGAPDDVATSMLLWHGPAPFVRTVVSAEGTLHNFPMPHEDVLEQAITFPTPLLKYGELAAFDGSLTMRRTEGLLSARCDSPEMNFLALNLAYEIITGRRTPVDARAYYTRAAVEWKNGTRIPYTEGLIFQPRPGADPDVATVRPS